MILEYSRYRLNCIVMVVCYFNSMELCIFRVLFIVCFCVWIGNICKICIVNDKSRSEKVELNDFLYWWRMKFLLFLVLFLYLFFGKKEFSVSNKYVNYNLGYSFKIFK